ncbi:GDP-mannose 4,6-dehydratase, partial [Bacillus toyonensis]
MAILITGGAGYIGSHTCIELLNNNYKIIVVDNLSNSSIESLNRVKEITGKQFKFYNESVLNREKMNEIFLENNIEAVIHFAGFKAVGESTTIPLTYY